MAEKLKDDIETHTHTQVYIYRLEFADNLTISSENRDYYSISKKKYS